MKNGRTVLRWLFVAVGALTFLMADNSQGQIVGAAIMIFAITWHIVQSKRKKEAEKYYIKQIKTNGDKPSYFGPFADMINLNLWYAENRELEGMDNVEVVKQ